MQLEEMKKDRRPSVANDVSVPNTLAHVGSRDVPETSPVAVTVGSATPDPQDMVKSMGLVLLESSNQPRFMGTSSGITFAKMVLAAIKNDSGIEIDSTEAQPRQHSKTPAPSMANVASSFPPLEAAEHIVRAYFSYRTPHIPVLEFSSVKEAIARVYQAGESLESNFDSVAEQDLFVVNMVFAVGLHSMPVHGGGRPSQSEACFHSALQSVERLLTYSPSNLETLTVVLLLAQYIALNPSEGSLWQLTGMALRLAIDLGLHWETNHVLTMSQSLLKQRRMLYWATYRLDRFLSITLGRPFGIAELSMNPGVPDPYISASQSQTEQARLEIYNQHCANHIVELYKLESEIKHVLYHQLQGSSLAYPQADYSLWLPDIQARLRAWKDEIPTSMEDQDSIYSLKSWWEAHYCVALSLLHRPNPRVPSPTTESLQTCFDISLQSIQAIKTLQRQGRVGVVWAWVHHLFLSGLTMIYCIWESTEVRNGAPIVRVMTASQDCASTLTALVERFADAAGCRDAFERLSSTTLKWLLSRESDCWTEAQRAPVLTREFEAIKHLMPSSSAGWHSDGGLNNLFPDEPYGFAQFLNTAAQWEDYPMKGDTLGSFL